MTRKLLFVIGIIFCLCAAAVAQIVTPGGGGTTGSGGTTGTLTNAAQFSIPYYSAPGTTNTLSGVAFNGLQLNSTAGSPAAYAGVTCGANQFLTGLTSSGAANSCLQPSATNLSGTVGVSSGGTGLGTLPANAVLLGNGTSNLASVGPVAAGSVLTSGSPPTWSASPTFTGLTLSGLAAGQCLQTGAGGLITVTGSSCGTGAGTGTVSPGTIGDTPVYTASTTIGDTGVLWPPRLDQLSGPMQGDYNGGGFFTILNNGTYTQIGAPLIYGSSNEQLAGTIAPRMVSATNCPVENVGSSTIATVATDHITLNTPLSGVPDPGTALNDTTAGVILPIAANGGNTTTTLFFASTTGFKVSDTVSTGTAAVCVTPSTVVSYHGLLVTGGVDQNESSVTIPVGTVTAPFTPGFQNSKLSVAYLIPITASAFASYSFSWPTPAGGGLIMTDVANVNLGNPFENTAGFLGTGAPATSTGFGGVQNAQVTDMFVTTSLQGTGNSQSIAGTPTQGKGIVEDVLYNASNAPAAACDNINQNAYGYIPPYNNALVVDSQWGGTYQRMIRLGPGGNVDHNLYYTRDSWNSNHTLMLGITTPPSSTGAANPWIVNLFDNNGCFLKPLYVASGASGNQPSWNWRATWSKTDPNVFYTTGVSGKNNGTNLSVNTIYAIHPCASANTTVSDPVCVANDPMEVQSLFTFDNTKISGSNFISTNQPTGASSDESGGRIGIVTRPTASNAGDYFWSSLAFLTSTSVDPTSLRNWDITANYPAGYCYQSGAVEKTRYINNGELVEAAGVRGSFGGAPGCTISTADSTIQWINDVSTPVQFSQVATDINIPWFSGGGHEAYSPHNAGAPGGGYFVYSHVAGASVYNLASCTSNVSNVATCTVSSGTFPVWPSGTKIFTKNISNNAYNGSFTTTATVTVQSTTISFQIASNPGAATGGTISDGNQWEIHSVGLNGTGDVTHAEFANLLSAQTEHSWWPWGSPANGGTLTDWFITGFAYNGLTHYPTQTVTSCSYTGTAPSGTATCTLANNLPGDWIVPATPQGSLGASTPNMTGISDGSTQCYNGSYQIIAATTNTFSYKPLCTPVGPATGGQAYLGPTDEIYQCYRGDATFGNGCIPLARTYSAQVTSDFFFQPLPNGSKEGEYVEFDSAPGVVPVSSFGRFADAATLQPTATTPYNPSVFFEYAAISPMGTIQATGSPAQFSGVTVALQGSVAQAPIVTLTGNGELSAQGGQVVNVAPPSAPNSALSEGSAIGSILPAAGTFTSLTDTTLTPGRCVQTTTGGLLAVTTTGCGTTTALFTRTITESGGLATMAVQSAVIPAMDTNYVALNANATVTTPAASAMADGEQIYLVATTSGTPFTVGLAAGIGTILKSIVLGDTGVGTPAACGAIPSTGTTVFKFIYDAQNTTMYLTACGINPPPPALQVAAGGTGLTTAAVGAPLFGNGTSPFQTGTLTGSTTKLVTSTGTLTPNDCAKWDGSGNLTDAGAACGSGGGATPFINAMAASTAESGFGGI